MKLSTRLKKEIAPELLFGEKGAKNGEKDMTALKIVFMVDCRRIHDISTISLKWADIHHETLKYQGCTLLTKESPVINSDGECILHYTSTTYKDWCNR